MSDIILAYCISTTIFIILLLFMPHLRRIQQHYLAIANIIAAILMVINIYYFVTVFEIHVAMIPAMFALLTLLRKLRRSIYFSILLIGIYGGFVLRGIIFLSYVRYIKEVNISMPYYYIPGYTVLPFYCIAYFAICYFMAIKISIK